jgi:hypothetical protein
MNNIRLPTFNSAKSSLYKSRRKKTPPLPRSMTDIALEGKWTQTATGGSFLLFEDNQPTRRIIATTENLRDLANADIFFCDGTFYTCHRQQDFKYHTETTTTSRLWFDEQQFYCVYLLHQLKTFGSRS